MAQTAELTQEWAQESSCLTHEDHAPAEVTAAEALAAAAEQAEAAGELAAAVKWHTAAGSFSAAAARAEPERAAALQERSAACRSRAAGLQAAAAAQAEEQRLERERLQDIARVRDRPSSVTAVAAIAGTAALVWSGPLLAVAAAGACALGTYRKDGVGTALNAVGDAAAEALMHVRGFNREHQLTVKAKEAARQAAARLDEAEDKLKLVAPNAAAALGTAVRSAKFVVGSRPLVMALEHAVGDSETSLEALADKPRGLLERFEGKGKPT
jgi:hypothetical protein